MPVWQDAKKLTVIIYKLSAGSILKKDFALCNQMQLAAVSIMSNISEGYERNNSKEFAHFLLYAKGSAGELRSQLHIALELGYISKDEFTSAYDLAKSISSQLANFVQFLRAENDRG
jgi:four helix bundle protein